MKLSYQLYLISKMIVADKFSGVIVTYPAKLIKTKKFKTAIERAIDLGYLGNRNGGSGDHSKYKHVAWLGEWKPFAYDQSGKSGRKLQVDRSYVDHLVMLCAKVKTILEKAKETNTQLPLKNSKNKNMNLDEYEKHFGITKEMAQANVDIVVKELFGK